MTEPAPRMRVVAALISGADGRRVLVQQRPPGKRRALLWEFPGGKVEPGESDLAALRREAREELGVELAIAEEVFQTRHLYPDLEVDLHVYRARITAGLPQARGGQVLREATLLELGALSFCEADQPLVERLVREGSEGRGTLP